MHLLWYIIHRSNTVHLLCFINDRSNTVHLLWFITHRSNTVHLLWFITHRSNTVHLLWFITIIVIARFLLLVFDFSTVNIYFWRITVLKVVILGGKSSILWSEISFYGDVPAKKCRFNHFVFCAKQMCQLLIIAFSNTLLPDFKWPHNSHGLGATVMYWITRWTTNPRTADVHPRPRSSG